MPRVPWRRGDLAAGRAADCSQGGKSRRCPAHKVLRLTPWGPLNKCAVCIRRTAWQQCAIAHHPMDLYGWASWLTAHVHTLEYIDGVRALFRQPENRCDIPSRARSRNSCCAALFAPVSLCTLLSKLFLCYNTDIFAGTPVIPHGISRPCTGACRVEDAQITSPTVREFVIMKNDFHLVRRAGCWSFPWRRGAVKWSTASWS